MATWMENGKVRRGQYPNGLYIMYSGEKHPRLVDRNYNGFRMIFRKKAALRQYGQSAYMVSDTLDGIKSPIDGKIYDSKSKYYRTVKEAGCEIVGNDSSLQRGNTPKELSAADRRQDIKRALEQHGF